MQSNIKRNPTIFDTMGTLFTKEYYPESVDIRNVPSYIMVNWISNSPNTIRYAHYIDANPDLDIEQQFKFLYHSIPKMFKPKFPKKLQEDNKDINLLVHKYKLSLSTAREYLQGMEKEDIKKLREEYKGFDVD